MNSELSLFGGSNVHVFALHLLHGCVWLFVSYIHTKRRGRMEAEETLVLNLYQILTIYSLYPENVNILFIIQIPWKYKILKSKFQINVQMYMYFDAQLT